MNEIGDQLHYLFRGKFLNDDRKNQSAYSTVRKGFLMICNYYS